MASQNSTPSTEPQRPAGPWYLFSPTTDLIAFAGSGVITIVGLAIARYYGLLDQDVPEWLWLFALVLMDGGHIFGTLFRVYLDREEVRRRPYLYWLTPLGCFLIALLAAQVGLWLYIRLIAYAAIFHFVRQQYGWVRLYRHRRGEGDKLGGRLDEITVYAATLYPLLYLHVHAVPGIGWLSPSDLVRLPDILLPFTVAYWAIMTAYLLKSLYAWSGRAMTNPGKDIVVVTTALCWYLGLVTFHESTFARAFCVVVLHAMPYYALTYNYTRLRRKAGHTVGGWFGREWTSFLVFHILLAILLKEAWSLVKGSKSLSLFGTGSWLIPREAVFILIPLLGTVQLTHYFLDAFIWRKKDNPDLQVFGH